eukprot:scaffold3517_cov169-Skeletonema_marinoi.AAC.10
MQRQRADDLSSASAHHLPQAVSSSDNFHARDLSIVYEGMRRWEKLHKSHGYYLLRRWKGAAASRDELTKAEERPNFGFDPSLTGGLQ